MLPSVTDVVRELAKVVSADPAVLFKAARGVVGEELAKVKQGFEAAPLDVLVKRARLQLERDGSGTPVSEAPPPPMPVFPARPIPARDAPAGPPKAAGVDDPFQDLASRSDLNWEKDLPIQPEDAPFRSAILPIPHRSRGPAEISAPIESVRERGQPLRPLTFAPGAFVPPRPQSVPVPGAPAPVTYIPDATPSAPELSFDFPEDAPTPLERPAVASAPSIPLVHPREPEAPATPDVHDEPAALSFSEIPPLDEVFEDDAEQPAIEEFHFKAADEPPPPAVRSGLRGWIVAIALVALVGAFLAWAVREFVFRNAIVKPAPAVAARSAEPTPVPTAVPAAIPTAAPVVAKPAAPSAKPGAPSAKPAPVVPRGKAAVLLTPDWSGKPTVYVIHFSSTKDRASAAKEAQKLGAALRTTARAVEVDLGDKGVWYRVVAGEFPDVVAARAFRAELEAKKTPGMGFVYEMRGR